MVENMYILYEAVLLLPSSVPVLLYERFMCPAEQSLISKEDPHVGGG